MAIVAAHPAWTKFEEDWFDLSTVGREVEGLCLRRALRLLAATGIAQRPEEGDCKQRCPWVNQKIIPVKDCSTLRINAQAKGRLKWGSRKTESIADPIWRLQERAKLSNAFHVLEFHDLRD
jgi:hypothetical protein